MLQYKCRTITLLVLSLPVSFLSFSSGLFESGNQELQPVVRDSANKTIFREHPGIDYISVKYMNNVPFSMFVFFKEDPKQMNREYYDLHYHVDSIIFKHKFGKITFPVLPRHIVNKSPEPDSKYEILFASLYPDSVRYRIARYSGSNAAENEKRKTIPLGRPPIYTGDITRVKEAIRGFYRHYGRKKDSIVVFQGQVNTLGELKDLGLIIGKKSKYTRSIQKLLEQNAAAWAPGKLLDNNSKLSLYIRIYIHQNRQGGIEMLTSPRNVVNITGK